jgi:G3E family GTPase
MKSRLMDGRRSTALLPAALAGPACTRSRCAARHEETRRLGQQEQTVQSLRIAKRPQTGFVLLGHLAVIDRNALNDLRHAVEMHLLHPPVLLPRWPSEDRRTRMVFITRGLPQQAIEESLIAFAEADLPPDSPLPFGR